MALGGAERGQNEVALKQFVLNLQKFPSSLASDTAPPAF